MHMALLFSQRRDWVPFFLSRAPSRFQAELGFEPRCPQPKFNSLITIPHYTIVALQKREHMCIFCFQILYPGFQFKNISKWLTRIKHKMEHSKLKAAHIKVNHRVKSSQK